MQASDWDEVEKLQRELLEWFEEQVLRHAGVVDVILREAHKTRCSLGEAIRRVKDRRETIDFSLSRTVASVGVNGIRTDPDKSIVSVWTAADKKNSPQMLSFSTTRLSEGDAKVLHDAFSERRLRVVLVEVP